MTLSVGNPRNTEKQELIIISSWLIRIPILAFCIYFLLYDFDTVNNDIKLLLGKYFTSTLLSIIHSIILLLALLYVSWFLFYNYSKLLKDKNIDKAIKIFFSIVLIPLAFTSLTYATISQNFSRLLGFLVIPFFLILIFGLLYTKIDQSKFLKEKLPISNFLFGTIMILIIFYFSIIYARNIYPQIPMNYGGAKPVHAILFTPIDTIYCNILNENSDWLLIKRDDDNFTEKIRSNSLQNILISDLIKSHTVSK